MPAARYVLVPRDGGRWRTMHAAGCSYLRTVRVAEDFLNLSTWAVAVRKANELRGVFLCSRCLARHRRGEL